MNKEENSQIYIYFLFYLQCSFRLKLCKIYFNIFLRILSSFPLKASFAQQHGQTYHVNFAGPCDIALTFHCRLAKAEFFYGTRINFCISTSRILWGLQKYMFPLLAPCKSTNELFIFHVSLCSVSTHIVHCIH